MKKIAALTLALVLMLSAAAPVSATDITQSGGERRTDVSASYQQGNTTGDVIRVDIAWEGMNFTYNAQSEPVWDPVNHIYSESAEAGWAESAAKITVTNHSNILVQARIEYKANGGFDAASLRFTDPTPYIGSAFTSETAEGTACSAVIRAIPDGTLPATTAKDTKIGYITVTVNALSGAEDRIKEAFRYVYTLYIGVQSADMAVNRGDLYFATQEDATLVDTALTGAQGVIYGTTSSLAEKNAALNSVIELFYSKLQIRQ